MNDFSLIEIFETGFWFECWFVMEFLKQVFPHTNSRNFEALILLLIWFYSSNGFYKIYWRFKERLKNILLAILICFGTCSFIKVAELSLPSEAKGEIEILYRDQEWRPSFLMSPHSPPTPVELEAWDLACIILR